MKIATYSELRRNLGGMIDTAAADHEPVLITRKRGEPAAVLMSLEDFASSDETRHLMSSPANAERLLQAVRDLDAGEGDERTLIP